MKNPKRITGYTLLSDASVLDNVRPTYEAVLMKKVAYFPEPNYRIYRITLVRVAKRKPRRGK
jgi:hypothetical protein